MIPTRIHGMLDYTVGVALIAGTWMMPFAGGKAETWVPVLVGVASILQGLLTNFELGLYGLIPVRMHLAMDALLALLLAASPWLFGFAEYVWIPHVAIGVAILLVAAMTSRTAARPALSRQAAPTSQRA